MQKINIVVSCSEKYLYPLCTTIYSVLINTSSTIFVNVLIDSTNLRVMAKLKSFFRKYSIQYSFVVVDYHFDNVNFYYNDSVFKHSTLRKLSIISSAHFKTSKILWLDSDTIVRDDISAFYEQNIDDFALCAIKDFGQFSLKRTYGNYFTLNKKNHFNSGVMLFNLNYIFQNDLAHKLNEIIDNAGKYCTLGDQDIFNILFYNRTKIADDNWNYQVKISHYKPILNDSMKIIHYTTYSKPWIISRYNCNKSLIKEYWKYGKKVFPIFYSVKVRFFYLIRFLLMKKAK